MDSLIKQNKLFEEIGAKDPHLEHFTQLIGQVIFSKQELKDIAEITDSTASQFGYL